MNPDGIPKNDAVQQVAIATGTRHVYVAGQIARDAEGQPVAPGDLAGQVAQAFRNVAVALEAGGATFGDVVRLAFYVVDWKPEKMAGLMSGMGRSPGSCGSRPRRSRSSGSSRPSSRTCSSRSRPPQ